MNSHKKRFAAPVSLLAASIALASHGVSAQGNDDAFLLEEIVVTAQKREQNLQDVPIAVSAFSGEQLQEAVVKDIFDLKNSAPGLQTVQEQNNSSSGFRVRGIGTSGQNFGLESAVGMYVDGVYRARQSAMIGEMIDVEAVEILRGPQGTLFGKNTPAGAIQFRTVAPSHEANGYASVTAGNYGQINASAAGNLSVIEDVLAVRGTVFRSERDGLYDVKGFGSEELNNRDREGVRLQALYTPTDDLSVRLIADYAVIDENCCGVSSTIDTLTTAGGPGSDAIVAGLGGTVFPGDTTGDFETALNFVPESKSRDRGLSAEVNWDVSDDYTLTSITAYRKFDSDSLSDSDFTDLDMLTSVDEAESTTFSQEFRITYTGDKMNAVVGAYYFQQDLDLDASLTAGADLNEVVKLGLGSGSSTFTDFQNLYNGIVGPGGAGAVPAATDDVFLSSMVAGHTAKQEHESWAIFGQFDYNLTEELILTAGLRYTDEEKDMTTIFNEDWTPTDPTSEAAYAAAFGALGDAFGGDNTALLALTNGMTDFSAFAPFSQSGWGGYLFSGMTPRDNINASLSDSQVTGTIKLSWLATEETMVYVSYGTGYKSGGTNTDRIAAGFNPVFDAETSESLEVGLKTEFPEQALRINAALHYTTVEDFQANTFTGTGFLLQNAGELESYGGELELFWVPAQNTEVSFNYAYTHAEYSEFDNGNCWTATPVHTGVADPDTNADGESCDRSGDKLPLTPEHAVNLGVKQSFSLADGIDAYVYGEYTFLSGLVQGNDTDPLKEQKDYGLLNLRAGVDFVDSDLMITLWGRNVLDEDYKGSTFDAPLQDGRLLTAAGEPRTYGITLNKMF
ncbi:TonB-dependent receptor [Maricurvus nonylphenolicus]|uniref:TonB-dependent receptor n=1 Tax=Maricurvus nonylphenolicus TaxID=1008307 RepID=UPI0036F1E16E